MAANLEIAYQQAQERQRGVGVRAGLQASLPVALTSALIVLVSRPLLRRFTETNRLANAVILGSVLGGGLWTALQMRRHMDPMRDEEFQAQLEAATDEVVSGQVDAYDVDRGRVPWTWVVRGAGRREAQIEGCLSSSGYGELDLSENESLYLNMQRILACPEEQFDALIASDYPGLVGISRDVVVGYFNRLDVGTVGHLALPRIFRQIGWNMPSILTLPEPGRVAIAIEILREFDRGRLHLWLREELEISWESSLQAMRFREGSWLVDVDREEIINALEFLQRGRSITSAPPLDLRPSLVSARGEVPEEEYLQLWAHFWHLTEAGAKEHVLFAISEITELPLVGLSDVDRLMGSLPYLPDANVSGLAARHFLGQLDMESDCAGADGNRFRARDVIAAWCIDACADSLGDQQDDDAALLQGMRSYLHESAVSQELLDGAEKVYEAFFDGSEEDE